MVVFSQSELKGKVSDTKTGEPLAGTVVKLDGAHVSTLTDFNGLYTFKNIKPGVCELIEWRT